MFYRSDAFICFHGRRPTNARGRNKNKLNGKKTFYLQRFLKPRFYFVQQSCLSSSLSLEHRPPGTSSISLESRFSFDVFSTRKLNVLEGVAMFLPKSFVKNIFFLSSLFVRRACTGNKQGARNTVCIPTADRVAQSVRYCQRVEGGCEEGVVLMHLSR